MSIKLSTLVNLLIASAVIGVAVSYRQFYLFHGVLLLFLVSLFFYIMQNNAKIRMPAFPYKLHYMFYFMLFWYVLSIIWSVYIPYSIQYVFYIFCGGCVALVIIYCSNTLNKLQHMFKVVSIVFISEIIFSLLEMLTSFRLPISPYSPYVYLFGRQGSDLNVFTLQVQDYLQGIPTGFQWNPNNLAATMCIILPFMLFHNNKYIKYFGSISVLGIIYATDSRGALLAALLIIVSYLVLYNKRYKKMLLSLLIIILLFITSIGIVTTDNLQSENSRVQNHVIGSIEATKAFLSQSIEPTNSIGIRQQLIANGISALRATHGLGVGGGASKWIQEADPTVKGIASMHNFWIELLVEGGIFFFLLFVVWYGLLCFRLYKLYYKSSKSNLNYFSGACSLALLGFIPAAFSPSSCIYILPMWVLFGFSISVLNISTRYLM